MLAGWVTLLNSDDLSEPVVQSCRLLTLCFSFRTQPKLLGTSGGLCASFFRNIKVPFCKICITCLRLIKPMKLLFTDSDLSLVPSA